MTSHTDVLTACCTASGLCPTNVGIRLNSVSHNSIQKRETCTVELSLHSWPFWQGVDENQILHLEFYTSNEVSLTWLLALYFKPCPSSLFTYLQCQALEACVCAGSLTFAVMGPGEWAEQQCTWIVFFHQMASNDYAPPRNISHWTQTKCVQKSSSPEPDPKETVTATPAPSDKRKVTEGKLAWERDSSLNHLWFK